MHLFNFDENDQHQSILVSLDKRTIIVENLHEVEQTPQNYVKSASVGDMVVRCACFPREKTILGQKVLALTQKGHVYRLILTQQRGITSVE